jgi:hypothetical protein
MISVEHIDVIKQIIKRKGYFEVSLRHRDEKLMRKCNTYSKRGVLKRLSAIRDGRVYFVLAEGIKE